MNVNELSGLELRRATWDALGKWPSTKDSVWNHCPPIEFHSGIAMDELYKFCAIKNFAMDMRMSPAGHTAVALRLPHRTEFFVDCYGRAPAEAICRAIVAASKKSEEKP